MMEVSVDEKRALWALTQRHLRSKTYGAVLLVRSALRAHAAVVEVTSRGDRLRVRDDGQPRDDELAAIVDVLRAPTVLALHALEARHGTDLLVALATAQEAVVTTAKRRVRIEAGEVVDDAPAPSAAPSPTVITIARDRALRKAERVELSAWLPSPRARVVVDGRALGKPAVLPPTTFFPRAFRAEGGTGLVGFSLTDATSKTTILTRGLWLAQDSARARGLPWIAVWDDDDVTGLGAVARARAAVDKAAGALLKKLADEFATLPKKKKQQLRSLLVRGDLPACFDDVDLFDADGASFSVSLAELRRRSRVVVGKENADVVVDDVARAFLHRALPNVKDALPRPRRRLRFALRQLISS